MRTHRQNDGKAVGMGTKQADSVEYGTGEADETGQTKTDPAGQTGRQRRHQRQRHQRHARDTSVIDLDDGTTDGHDIEPKEFPVLQESPIQEETEENVDTSAAKTSEQIQEALERDQSVMMMKSNYLCRR